MGNLALRVDGLSKLYRIRTVDPYAALRAGAVFQMRRIKRALCRQPPPERWTEPANNLLWALKDVSFEVPHGQTVGVIGRNGAGKSTLLKILSRITRPTAGTADIYGKLGALLEVGTGFHPELTGRENIFLNATILGLDRREILRRFDEIVDFAEIGPFVDMPVKHYSTGMYMRLAFSVSAHLDPDILVLDEVLAVGDASFQKKCMGKMEGVRQSGRTVLLVSHSVATIAAFCQRCLLIEHGRLVRDGDAADVTAFYQDSLRGDVASDNGRVLLACPADLAPGDVTAEEGARYGDGKARFTALEIVPLGPDGAPQKVLRTGGDLRIEAHLKARERIMDSNVAVIIYDAAGYRLIDVNSGLKDDFLRLGAGEEATVEFVLREVLLKPGIYKIGLWLGRPNVTTIDGITFAATLEVEIDPARTRHLTVFPGAYQCKFHHQIRVGQAATAPETADVQAA